jgi:hypothetical protein
MITVLLTFGIAAEGEKERLSQPFTTMQVALYFVSHVTKSTSFYFLSSIYTLRLLPRSRIFLCELKYLLENSELSPLTVIDSYT